MSGAYHNRFVEEVFVYEYEGLVRKSFVDERSARNHFDREDRRVKWRFLRSHARVGELLRARGVGPWDPFLDAEDVPDEEALGGLESFPRNVRLPFAKRGMARESLELTLRAPLDSMRDLLAEAASLLPDDGESGDEHRDAFVPPPVCAHRLGVHVGLFVGATVEMRAEPAVRLRSRFQDVLDRLFPHVEERLSDPAKIGALGLRGARPLRDRLPQAKDEARLFNPWGPLYDVFARERVDLGTVSCILLFAPAHVDPSRERLSTEFLEWLRERAMRAAAG